MLILHHGKGCEGCPFFSYTHVVVGGECKGEIPVCGLDGRTPTYEPPLIIKIGDPKVSPGTCPFKDVHGIPVEVQRV